MLEILDTAGQEEYTALRDQWIRDGEGFVLVYSITNRHSFTRIQKFFSQVQRVKEFTNPSSPTNPSYLNQPMSPTMSLGPAPVMLVGNKSDRHHEREVSAQEGQALARELGCEFVEASAKNCINVEKAFFDVVRLLRRQRMSLNNARPFDRKTGFGAVAVREADPSRLYREDRVKEKKTHKCIIL